MSKTEVPKVGGGGGDVGVGDVGVVEGVEGPGVVTSENHGPAGKSLHRETRWVKFNGAIVIDGKLTNRDKIFDNMWY